MDKKLFVIVIAIVASLISTFVSILMQRRDLNPTTKRLLWISFAAGVVTLVAISMLVLSR
jgi:hypothetical protein